MIALIILIPLFWLAVMAIIDALIPACKPATVGAVESYPEVENNRYTTRALNIPATAPDTTPKDAPPVEYKSIFIESDIMPLQPIAALNQINLYVKVVA